MLGYLQRTNIFYKLPLIFHEKKKIQLCGSKQVTVSLYTIYVCFMQVNIVLDECKP